MDAPEASNRQAVMLVRFVAICLILVGLLNTGLYVAHCFRAKKPAPDVQAQNPAPGIQLEQSAPLEALPMVTNFIPFVAGVVILFRTKSIADWISEKLE